MNPKKLRVNFLVFFTSAALTLAAMEWIFPHVLNKLPISMREGLDEGVLALAQTSKRSVVPENYIALVGDSNAFGLGDWFLEEFKDNWFSRGDYHSAHIIYRRTGRDVISFGAQGAGSLRGLVSEPITRFNYINSLWPFSLAKPAQILVYFYEGNDLTDNWKDVNLRFLPQYEAERLYEPEYFRKFIAETVLGKDPLYKPNTPWINFLFSRFLLKGVHNGFKEVERGWHKLRKTLAIEPEIRPRMRTPFKGGKQRKTQRPKKTNTARVAGQEVFLHKHLSGGPLDMVEEERKLGLYVFEQSLKFLADFYKGVPIGVVYIPAPLSTYELTSDKVAIKTFMHRERYFDSHLIRPLSQEICRKIESIARAHQFDFLDARHALREAALNELIHGPRDWHLNKKGYQALANAILAAFFNNKNFKEGVGCEAKI